MSTTVTAVVCAFIALSTGAASANALPAPSAAAILTQAKLAAGGNALDAVRTLYLSERVQVMGASGSGQEYDDVAQGRFAQFMDLGPLSNGNGFDGAQPWVQDPSGDAWPVGDFISTHTAQSAAYLTSLSFWYPHRRPGTTSYRGLVSDPDAAYYVIRALPAAGFPVDIWIDTNTKLIRREIVRIPGGRDTISTMSDYRHVGNVVLPFASRTIASGNVIETKVSRAVLNVDVDKHVTLPSSPVSDALIAGGTTTIPFDLVNNHVYVSVKLDGTGPYRFIFDTGGQNVVTPEVAERLGSAVTGSLNVSGAGANTVSTGFAWIPTVSIGAATLRHQSFAVLPIAQILQAVEGEKIDGIVGVEVLRRFITTIDYQRSTMTLASRVGSAPPGTAIPFVYDQSVPLVPGILNDLHGRFVIDTGNRTSLVVYAPFVQAHGLLAAYPSVVRGITGYGLGGPSMGQLVRVPSMVVGTVVVDEPVTTLSLDKTGALTEPGTAGNVGGGILKRFTVTFNYRRQIMYLDPNDTYKVHDTYDRSGLVLVQSRAGVRVISALTGTPAFEAGMRSGDVLLTVNDKPAAAIGLLNLRTLLRGAPGTVIHMSVRSGESAKSVTFKLRTYV